MSNTVPQTWVKNVYSLRITSGVVSGESLNSYTPPTLATQSLWVQVPSFTQVYTNFSAVLSTAKNALFNLLNTQLYPVSTAPIIKKKKENKERNS